MTRWRSASGCRETGQLTSTAVSGLPSTSVSLPSTPGALTDQLRVFVGAVVVVDRHRGIVDRGDRQGDGDRIAVEAAVVGSVGEAVGAVVVRGRCVSETAVAVAASVCRGDGPLTSTAVSVPLSMSRVVTQHAGGVDGQLRILVGAVTVGSPPPGRR